MFDIFQTDYSIYSRLRIFPLFLCHTWKYNIQANGRLAKVKEKSSTIQSVFFFWSFFHSLHSNASDNKCHKHKRCMVFFTRAGMCMCDRMHQMEKTEVYFKCSSFQQKSKSINEVLLKYKQSVFSCFYTSFIVIFRELT